MNRQSPRKSDLGYGYRLSDQEYEQQIVKLYSGLPPIPDEQLELDIRHRELNLTIDYRLGRDFPGERRDALWEIQKNVEGKRLRLAWHAIRTLLSYPLLFRRGNNIAKYLVDEYAKVLTRNELKEFFGDQESERPALPIDKNLLRKS